MRRKHPLLLGKIYHIYNRGVAKCKICKEEADYWRFLQGLCLFNDSRSATNILWQLQRNRGKLTLNVLKDYIKNQSNDREKLVKILAYCIRGNHYHLLVEEIKEGGITRFMHKLGLGYSRYFNNKYDRPGSLFQDKFKNILVDNDLYLQYLLVYINVLNVLEDIEPSWREDGIKNIKRVLEYIENYQWSTHQEYLGKRKSLIIEKGIFKEILPTPDHYRELVNGILADKKNQKYKLVKDFLFDNN